MALHLHTLQGSRPGRHWHSQPTRLPVTRSACKLPCWRASKATCRVQVPVCQELEGLLHIQLLDGNVADACHTT